MTNPTVLVEVTSDSTEDYDRGAKVGHYKQVPSLFAILVVSHRRRQVTAIARADSGWTEQDYRAGDQVVLATPAVRISVDELYADIELP